MEEVLGKSLSFPCATVERVSPRISPDVLEISRHCVRSPIRMAMLQRIEYTIHVIIST